MSDCRFYDCKEAFQRLDDYVDRELTADEMVLVKIHLEKCQHCAQEFEFEEDLLLVVKAKLQHIDLPPDLLERLRTALDRC